MQLKIFIVVLLISVFLIPKQSFSQGKDLFTYSTVHKVEERASFSIFYPNGTEEYKGILVLIHSQQASNPKVYGDFIEKFLRKNYIIIYPAYQEYVLSQNKLDLEFISSSLKQAEEDIKKNYEDVKNLPVAYIGHSMGGVIAYELASGKVEVPKSPSCVIALCPAEVKSHKINEINFKKLDSYDVYLILEEEKDNFYNKGTGTALLEGISNAERKRHIVHSKDENGDSKHMNFWSPNKDFSSGNNTFVTYFPGLIGKTDAVDSEVYWLEISNALDCAFSRKNCEGFSEE